MATTGPALYPGSGTFPGSSTYPGQGNLPQLEVLYSTDDASASVPTWTYVPPSQIRSFSVSRGRDSELSDIDAGTATIVLRNDDRAFDQVDPIGNNLITNPSFEIGNTASWVGVGSPTSFTASTSGNPPYGKWLGEVFAAVGAGIETTFQAHELTTYTVSFSALVDAAYTMEIRNMADNATIASVVAAAGAWTRYFVTFTTQAGQVLVPIRFMRSGGAGTQFGLLDGVKAELGNVATPFPNIRPMNRWWIREKFSGETQDIFRGYADSYDHSWPAPVGDATVVVNATDEFKVLALDHLPTMDPPRDTYADLVKSDVPASYWRFHDFNNLAGDPGPAWTVGAAGGYAIASSSGAIIGDAEPDKGHLMMIGSGNAIETTPEAFDTQGQAAMTVEFWFRISGNPGAQFTFLRGGTQASGTKTNWFFDLTTSGVPIFAVYNSTPTQFTATSSVALASNVWYHIAGVLDGAGSACYIVVNGVTAGSGGWSGTLPLSDDAANPPLIQNTQAITFSMDELAWYPVRAFTAARLLAHYTAGVNRGFVDGQAPGFRAGAVLDATGSRAPRSIQQGVRTMTGAFMRGQDPLSELRECQRAENVDALLFVARDGTLTFLAAAQRAGSPYDAVQATFDDDGTDLPYADLGVDYSESFLINEWNVTAKGNNSTNETGSLQTASDATSIARYFKRSQSLTDLPLNSNAQASTIATAMLAKFKDPFTRITSITLTTADPSVAEAIFRRDIGDRIRILRTPPGGGDKMDQTSFIQKIEISGDNSQAPWQVRWAVAPL